MNTEKSVGWVWCAVNVYGWAFGDCPKDAKDKLAMSTDGSKAWTDEHTKKYQLRVFRFPADCRPDGWCWYCPVFEEEGKGGREYWLEEDTMRDYDSSVAFPIKQVSDTAKWR